MVVLPVSAVTRTGSTGAVQVLDKGVLTKTDLSLGRVGLATIEITSGLRAGQTVVVADNTFRCRRSTSAGCAAAAAGAP